MLCFKRYKSAKNEFLDFFFEKFKFSGRIQRI